ncbi:MAG: hotdog fold thioesterase [Clostridia bacterium]
MKLEEIHRRFEKDRFAILCGMSIDEIGEGYAKVSMTAQDKHLNGVDIVQGGVLFTLADLALACASNSHGPVALALQASISYLKPAGKGALSAVAREISLKKRIGVYQVEVSDTDGLCAIMTGTVYRKEQEKV